MKLAIVISALLAYATAAAAASVNVASPTLLDEGYRHMYNLRFGDAHRVFHEWEAAHPDDPMGPVSDAAAYLFSEFDRLRILQTELFADNQSFFNIGKLTADRAVKRRFDDALAGASERIAARLRKAPGDPNALFADVLRIGLHADYLALIDRKYMASLGEMKTGRAMAQKLLSEHPEYYDAHLAVGVENYLLSQKPAPVRWFLRMGGAQTDKEVGIEKLRLTAEKGRYLLPYARLLLAVADLRDHEPAAARQKLEWLAREFPENPLYQDELSKLR